MATREEIGIALQAAHKAGDVDNARILADAYANYKEPDMPWSDVGTQAIKSIPSDIKNIGQATIDTVLHPIDTATGLTTVARGAMQHALPDVVTNALIEKGITPEARPQATAFAAPFKADFGSVEGFKRALAERPLSTALNASAILSGLSGAIKGASKVGKFALEKGGAGIGQAIGDVGTHTGGETIIDAARAGYQGGSKLKAFTDYMREKVPLSDIVKLEKKGMAGIAKKDSLIYKTGMDILKRDPTQLNYAPIEEALNTAGKIGTYEGHVVNPAAIKIQNQLQPIIEEWSGRSGAGTPKFNLQTNRWEAAIEPGFDPALSHTIAGLDALKKRVGIVYKSTDAFTPEREVAKQVYGAVKGAIAEQSSAYDKLMKVSQAAIKQRKEFQKELSLNENLTDSTALRKALAVPRNNANTNYGNRVALAQMLEDNGATNLMSSLNGAALSSIKPRGLGVMGASGTTGAGLYSLLSGNLPAAAGFTGLTAMQSPRLMGELAIKAGQAAKIGEKTINIAGKPFDVMKLKTALAAALLAKQNELRQQE